MTVGQLKEMLAGMNDDYEFRIAVRPIKICLAENDEKQIMVMHMMETEAEPIVMEKPE